MAKKNLDKCLQAKWKKTMVFITELFLKFPVARALLASKDKAEESGEALEE